jgi:hypothetical protein
MVCSGATPLLCYQLGDGPTQKVNSPVCIFEHRGSEIALLLFRFNGPYHPISPEAKIPAPEKNWHQKRTQSLDPR